MMTKSPRVLPIALQMMMIAMASLMLLLAVVTADDNDLKRQAADSFFLAVVEVRNGHNPIHHFITASIKLLWNPLQ